MSKFFAISLVLCVALFGTTVGGVEAKWIIQGRVLDDKGEPAAGFEVAAMWSANGQQWNDDGTFPKLDSDAAISEWWDDEGEFAPHPQYRGRVDAQGRFEIAVDRDAEKDARVVLVLNNQRTHGGLAYVSRAANQPITIVLEPLVRVHGKIRCAGAIPKWTYACVLPGNLKEPPD